jgi:hypothetical protein
MLTTVLRLEASGRTGCAIAPLEIGVSERIPYLDGWPHYRAGTAAEASLQAPAPEEPVLQLELDSAGVEVVPSPPRTAERNLRRLQEAHYGTARRVQWDSAHSRLVF